MKNCQALFKRARRCMPGGVNSPVRSFNKVGGTPIYVKRAKGAIIETVDGKKLVDFCGSWGNLILGHAQADIVTAVEKAARRGMSYGINHEAEIEIAELIKQAIPSIALMRLVSSGTEATMTALRLARGFTGRKKILKFAGCYHGHSDALLVNAGSGLLTSGMADSAGVTPAVAADTIVADYNNLAAVKRIVDAAGKNLAGIIVEPVAGNMGLVPPLPGFLTGLRELATAAGAVLIFDEVISGFRLTWGGYQNICKVVPDLTCLGKIIGGGLPMGAIGGRRDIMSFLAPLGSVYQAGTLSGNPVAVAAGLATLRILRKTNPYETLDRRTGRLVTPLTSLARAKGIPLFCRQMGSMFTVFFSGTEITNLAAAKKCDSRRYAKFFHGMLEHGFYLPPAQFETAFVSTSHTDQEINAFIKNALKVMGNLK